MSIYEVGERIYFEEEKRPFTVRARDARYLICTKPFSAKHTVIYTIVDLKEGTRGPDNMVFGRGYESDIDCQQRLHELQSGEIELSRRRSIQLRIQHADASSTRSSQRSRRSESQRLRKTAGRSETSDPPDVA